MMGVALPPEKQKEVNEKVAKKVAEQKAWNEEHGYEPPKLVTIHDHDQYSTADAEHSDEPESSEAATVVDDQTVINYILSRQKEIDDARKSLRVKDAEIVHLKNQLAIAESKITALQKAVSKLREDLKAAKYSDA